MHYLERLVQETQDKAHELKTEDDSFTSTDMAQSQQLVKYESKVSELETAPNAVVIDKGDTFGQLHLWRKTLEDPTQNLASYGTEFQSQISSLIMEESTMLNKMYQNAKEELQAVTVHVEEQKEREISLRAEVGKLKSEIRIMELAIVEKELVQNSKLEEHANLLQEKDGLIEQIKKLQNDVDLAQSTIAEQKEVASKMELEWEAEVKQSLIAKEAESELTSLVKKQVEEMKQQLQIAKARNKEEKVRIELVAEEGKKILALNVVIEELKKQLSRKDELKSRIADLQNKLQVEIIKSSEQAS